LKPHRGSLTFSTIFWCWIDAVCTKTLLRMVISVAVLYPHNEWYQIRYAFIAVSAACQPSQPHDEKWHWKGPGLSERNPQA